MKKLLIAIYALSLIGCSSNKTISSTKESEEPIETKEAMIEPTQEAIPQTLSIASTDLVDGVWNTDITKSNGSNRTPQLSWNAIDGAQEYAIFMIDTSANNWMHWRATNITATSLDAGSNVGEYVGPYPPSGTHTYIIRVYALSSPTQAIVGNMDSTNDSDLTFIENALGNVIMYEEISGTYTAQ